MDQVRVFARIVWEQRFWVLSVLATSVAVACWYLAAGDLDSRFSKRLSTISGQISAVKGLANEAFHPNDEVNKEDRAQAVVQSKSVYQVWSDLYERQHAEVLQWPPALGPQFIEHMKDRKFLDDISQDMRNIYWNFIKTRFDKLLEIVKARKSTGVRGGRGSRFPRPEREGSGGPPGRSGSSVAETEEDRDYLVEWLDQGALRDRLSFSSMPTYKQIWVTQEDLWVYETLLDVINKTNEQKHATRPDNTAVRIISLLQVGSPAIGTSTPPGGIYMPSAEGGGGEYAGGEGSIGARAPSGGLYEGGGEGGPEGSGDATLLENRYLDPEGQPVSGDSLSAEYRQLPVHMKLTMDQRFLPQLLIECANATLPIEVKWIRVNPEKARSVTSSGRGERVRKADAVSDVNLATVEIQGVVLIYGEPNKELLSVPGAEEEDNELAGASPATS